MIHPRLLNHVRRGSEFRELRITYDRVARRWLASVRATGGGGGVKAPFVVQRSRSWVDGDDVAAVLEDLLAEMEELLASGANEAPQAAQHWGKQE